MKSILCYESPAHPSMGSLSSLKAVAIGTELTIVSSTSACLATLEAKPHHIVVSNHSDAAVFATARQKGATTILMTELPMQQYSEQLDNREHEWLDHVIAFKSQAQISTQDLFITVRKLLTGDLFGIDQYLQPGSFVNEVKITHTGEREFFNNQVQRFAEDCKLGSHIAKAVWGISEEMLMNAVYDAPVAAGLSRFLDLPRSQRMPLQESEQSTLRFACDGEVFIVAVSDPFGLLEKDKFFSYLRKVLKRHDSQALIDTKQGGAGLGLFKILYNSHSIVVNVDDRKRTEIIAILDLNEQLRDVSKMARTIHYFSTSLLA